MIVNALQKLKSFGFEPKNILDKVNTPKDSLLYSKAMESAITLVKNNDETLPLSTNKKYLHVSFGKNNNSEYLTNKMDLYVDVERFEGDDYSSIYNKTDYDAIIISYQRFWGAPKIYHDKHHDLPIY